MPVWPHGRCERTLSRRTTCPVGSGRHRDRAGLRGGWVFEGGTCLKGNPRRHSVTHETTTSISLHFYKFYLILAGAWEIEYTSEFGDWWDGLSIKQQEALDDRVMLLDEK